MLMVVSLRLPDWLNPWWAETREIRSPLDEEKARSAIANSSGFLKGSLGRVLFDRSLTVFRESWWHLRRPWVIAHITVVPANPGSIVRLRFSRSWFQSAFITFFAIFALGVPLVFLGWTIATDHFGATWWTYLAWIVQDAAIYAAVMALNSGAVRNDSKWLLRRVGEIVMAPNDTSAPALDSLGSAQR